MRWEWEWEQVVVDRGRSECDEEVGGSILLAKPRPNIQPRQAQTRRQRQISKFQPTPKPAVQQHESI